MSVSDEFLTTADVAKLLQIGVKAAHARRIRGNGPPFMQLGPRTVRYERRAVLDWLRSHTATVAQKDGAQ
jgi:predicted DNA-binding transcriptional regulator AlpA